MSTNEQMQDEIAVEISNEQTQKAVDLMKAEAEREQGAANIEAAIADLRRQLRGESKADLIRQWIGLYAQVVQLMKENEALKRELNSKASALVSNEAETSEGDSK